MATGGSTWDTAGLLTLGAGNTFASADAIYPGFFWNDEGYWKFTLTTTASITITAATSQVGIDVRYGTFSGGSEVTYLGLDNGNLGPARFYADAGVEYHVIAGKKSFGEDVPTYTLTFEVAPAAVLYTPWSSEFKERTDNELIISSPNGFSGELMNLNPPDFNTVDNTHDFFYEVVESTGTLDRSGFGPPQRVGRYYIQEVLGGPNIDADTGPAADCAWSHAKVGHEDQDLTWNGTCATLPADLSNAEDESSGIQPFYQLTYTAQNGLLIAAGIRATVRHVARGAWFLPVRDNLLPWGVLPLSDINIADYLPGYVGPYAIEWEDPYVELLAVYVGADRADRSVGDAIETTFHVNLDTDKLPGYSGGVWNRHWQTGLLGVEVAPPPPTRKVRFTGGDTGAASWHHLDAILDWSDCASFPDDQPDAIIGMELDLPTRPAVNTTAIGDADVAFKFVLRAPRFRYRYYSEEPAGVLAPLRLRQRGDSKAGGADRSLSRGRTSDSRVRGRIF